MSTPISPTSPPLNPIHLPIPQGGGPSNFLSQPLPNQPEWTAEQIQHFSLWDVLGMDGCRLAEEYGKTEQLEWALSQILIAWEEGGVNMTFCSGPRSDDGSLAFRKGIDFASIRYFLGVRAIIGSARIWPDFAKRLEQPMGEFFASQEGAGLHILANQVDMSDEVVNCLHEAFSSVPVPNPEEIFSLSLAPVPAGDRYGPIAYTREIVRLRGNLGYVILNGVGKDVWPRAPIDTLIHFCKDDAKLVQDLKKQEDQGWTYCRPVPSRHV